MKKNMTFYGISMMQVASDDLKGDFSRFDEGFNDGVLEEAVDTLKYKDETR